MSPFSRMLRAVAIAGGLVGALGVASPRAQTVPAQPDTYSGGERIPFDAGVRAGALPNGLQYFIRRNAQPANRLLLRLAVKAGSIDEADDQQGLAHLIEHMAFNGTTHFKPGELVSYFESTGTRLGPHVNAYTSFEETVYLLELPTDPPEIVSKGLTALADFAGGLTLDPEQVERERGVVIEEWRGRLGAGSRIGDLQIPVLYHQSRYAERLPIGKPDIIRGAPVARLRDFYDTWYRPARMAVVAVGDISPEAIEAAIRSAFGSIEPRAPAALRVEAAVPLHEEALVSVAADPEVTQSTVQWLRKRPSQGQELVGDYRRQLVGQLFSRMFNERLNELARKPDAGFLSAGVGGGSLGQTVDTFSMSARVPDGSLVAGLNALLIEAKRIAQFGFHQSELDRAKRSMASSYDRAYNERDKTESGSYAREYVSHFLTGEPSPGIGYEYRLVEQVLPGITLEEVAARGRTLLASGSQVVLAVSPAKGGLAVPSPQELTAALAAVETVAVTPWNEASTALALMADKPARGAVESERELADLGITVVRFANGVEAWLKPTDFKNDQVVFTMYAPGGASLAPPSGFINASLAPSLVGLSGVGDLKALELQRLLAGKPASASPFISLSTHGVSGSAAPSELETALQLLYQVVTAPGNDPEAFALLKRQFGAMVANRGQSPGQVFGERLSAINASGHYTAQALTSDDLAVLDQARMLAFYRDRFANAADFTLFMVGAFEPRAVVPLLAQYVGSLPSSGRSTSQFQDLDIRFPDRVQHERVQKGREPRSNTVISFFADPPPDPAEQERISAAITVLETTMRDLLREDLGQTYTVSVGLAQSLPQRGGGHIQVRFGAAPENIQAMTDRVLAEVRRLQQEGPSSDLTASAKESARRTYETSLKQNAYWMRRMQTIHMLGGDPADILTREARIQAVTPALIQDTFKRYFPLDRYTVVTLVPEPSAGQP
jgi:zinc protease